MKKEEIALEIYKSHAQTIVTYALKSEKHSFSKGNFGEFLADVYNQIYDSVKIDEIKEEKN